MRTFLLLLSPILVIAALFAACGDDADSNFHPGQIVCDGLGKKSYHYTMHVVQEVKEYEGTPVPPNLTAPITVLWDIKGANEGGSNGGAINIKQHNEINGTGGDSETILLENDVGYVDIGQGFRISNNPDRPATIPYWPIFTCRSLAPDMDTTKLGTAQPETINGVPSQKYSFEDLSSEWLSRSRDFGSGSQAGANIHSVSGSIWVADKGDLITKLDIVAAGQYPTGQKISVAMQFELSDLDTDIKVRAPI